MKAGISLWAPKRQFRLRRSPKLRPFRTQQIGQPSLQRDYTSTSWCIRRDQAVLSPSRKHGFQYVEYATRRPASTASSASRIPKVLVNDMPNQELLIELPPGQAVRYPSFWLRDHCLCSVCSHPDTHQRQHDTFGLDTAIKASKVTSTESGVDITWSDPSDHASTFPWSWLQRHTPFATLANNATTRHRQSRRWTPFLPSTPMPKTSYDSIMSTSTGLCSLLNQLQSHGICSIPSTPPSPTATESLLVAIGPIRNTHYGAFWDFTSEVNPIDTAYTNLYLPLHTDNTYFTEPAGLQLFHLLSHTSATHPTNSPGDYDGALGGESTFSDGFAAAARLHALNPSYYNVLSTVPIVWVAEGSPAGPFRNNLFSQSGNPVFTHHSASQTDSHPSNLTCVRWNNLDRSPLTTFPSHQTMLQWYAAAKLYSELLHSEEFMITTPLRPGEPVIFDNWRVLHGRKAFEGRRRMCGAYLGADDWWAKLKQIRESEQAE